MPAKTTDTDESSVLPALTAGGPTVTWLGHATTAIRLGGRRLLVDPLGRARTRRAGPVDVVLITHSHVDHLNRWSLRAIDRAAHLIVPRGAAPIVSDLGFAKVTEVMPGDEVDLGGVELTAVPTRHDNGRWNKRELPLCNGYVVRGTDDGKSVFHAGDVDFSDHRIFDDIGKRFALDVALLPIGGMMPVWYYRWRRAALDRGIHIDPDCALEISERLAVRTMVPVHWGTVHLPFGPPSAPKKRLQQVADARGLTDRVRILAHAETLDLA